ncbi:MAG: ABC transporter permease [Oscillospiraceae bacterium]|jgi:ribose/xylose/arabinose/galactoside ABC-type transport system permease subunit|nr:ABC transporter permease [Oscillospiraceae bacterium]
MNKKSFLKSFNGSKMLTLLLLLLFLVLLFSLLTDGIFIKPLNIRNIVNNMSVVGLLTVGAGCLLISGHIDLSAGAVGTMCGVILAKLLESGLPSPAAFIGTLAIGCCCGALNAALVNELRFQSFIATLAVASVAQGATFIINAAQAVKIKNETVIAIGTGLIGNIIPFSILITIVAFIVYGFILNNTKFGRSVYLIGGSPMASLFAGLHPKTISYTLFINSGALGAIAGMLLAARMKTATVTGILNSQFSGMTAAILGGISFGGGAGGLGGAFVGLLILNSFDNGMQLLGINPYWQTIASGALLLAALFMDYVRTQRTAKSVRLG